MKKHLLYLLITFSPLLVTGQPKKELIVKNKIDHLSMLAREPMIAQHPNGSLFLTGYRNDSDSPQLWTSTDLGKNWEAVNVGSAADGAQGNSDVDLLIDETGTIYFLSMTYTKIPADMTGFDFSTLKGEQITLGISRDEGMTWKWQNISKGDYDDRPWIRKTTNGDLHIIWNDGNGVHYSRSTDQGETWERQAKIAPKGGSSFLANGHNGQLAARVAPLSASGNKLDQGIDLVRLSLDNGRNWQDVELPGERSWTQDFSGIPRWVEPLSFDQAGRFYTLWSEGKQLKMGMSSDNGQHWTEQLVAESQDTIYYPYMETHGAYTLCTWVEGFNDKIRHHAAVIQVEKDKLHIFRLDPQKLDIRSRFQIGDNQLSTGGEYFPIIRLSNGNFGMATTIQNKTANRLGFTWWELILNKY